MAILKLHDRLNPTRIVLQDRDEISAVDVYQDGSVVWSKGGSQLYVSETPEDIYELIKEKQ
jgi:hypothetical protein